MNPKRFHLVSRWRVRAPARSVFTVLADLSSLSSWWPGVHSTSLGASSGVVGRRARVEIAGLLPIAIRTDVEIVAAEPDREIAVVSYGQLEGSGEWRLHEHRGVTQATFTWDVELERRGLEAVVHWLRPLLVLSHRYAMWRGERGLRRLLQNGKLSF